MTGLLARTTVVAAAAVALAATALPGTAGAATVVRFDGWVTTPTFADPVPWPTAHYTGTVGADGWITVKPDCVKGGLGGPTAPCLAPGIVVPALADRSLRWWNDGKGYGGEVKARPDGSFTAQVNEKNVTFTVLGKVGAAVGHYHG